MKFVCGNSHFYRGFLKSNIIVLPLQVGFHLAAERSRFAQERQLEVGVICGFLT